MKIGVIGLGDIAQKAYLPVLGNLDKLELHLFTRNETKLIEISSKYRFRYIHKSLKSLMDSGIKGAFVHSSTESHYEIVKELLLNGIHVYVDKPITYHYETAKELVELAENKHLILMTGFNRRFAPHYRAMKKTEDINMIIMQKNRHSLPGDIRTFVYDDFIHCLDTVRFLFQDEVEQMNVNGRKKDGLLYHVVVQLISKGQTAIAVMNRDSGAVEEKLEVMSPMEKRTVIDLADMSIQHTGEETSVFFNNWDSTLFKRGFEQIIAEFIRAVQTNSNPAIHTRDALQTHELCEYVVQQLERN